MKIKDITKVQTGVYDCTVGMSVGVVKLAAAMLEYNVREHLSVCLKYSERVRSSFAVNQNECSA